MEHLSANLLVAVVQVTMTESFCLLRSLESSFGAELHIVLVACWEAGSVTDMIAYVRGEQRERREVNTFLGGHPACEQPSAPESMV